MHGTFRSELGDSAPAWTEPFVVPSTVAPTHDLPFERSTYGARRPNWPLIGFILAAHIALLSALIMFDVIPIRKAKAEPLVIDLVEMKVVPPEQKPVEQKQTPEPKVIPQVTAPTPIIQPPTPAPIMAVAPSAPQLPPVVAPPAPSGPVSVSDLGAKMIVLIPPRYPMESRRRKEQGTVQLAVVLNADGSVATVQLAQSSGFDRLDKAALDAVRKWRWSPTVRAGVPVMVRGVVDIPFILKV